MTKAELIDGVAEQTDLTKRQIGIVVDLMLDTISTALVRGDKVQLIPFGSFTVRERSQREGRNPKTGATLTIPERRVPAFTPGKGLRDAVATVQKRPAKNGKPARVA